MCWLGIMNDTRVASVFRVVNACVAHEKKKIKWKKEVEEEQKDEEIERCKRKMIMKDDDEMMMIS